MNIISPVSVEGKPPFDEARLDRLMDEAGIDLLLATAKHTVQFLLGGYRFIIFHSMDAIGHSRYLPFVIYKKGNPDRAAFIGNALEGHEKEINPFWTPNVNLTSWG